jgi:hypothetical protein
MGLNRVKINGDWFDAKEWMGALELTKFGSPIKYTAKEPFAHISGLYHIFDKDGNKVGEIDSRNSSYSGCVDDYDVDNEDDSDSTSSYTDSTPKQKPEGFLGYLGAWIGFILKSNWGGRIGFILGIILTIIVVVSSLSDDNLNFIIFGIFGIIIALLLGTIGSAIGGLIKFIIRKSKENK